ncbi:hypothetical protein CHL67_01410 [Prosthecochloris sp. GSB1]|uniref:hypothetical protein n=1 Tax=Prosthecochloris sp. GSB1 TaxID=281093 RepID=UPI000B8CE5A1|nr:hypothetical protein [Prosthecochloris sp. GSB1]ASQ89755.1 hypothetical protein CHL67_01410 [Prosthecochloris sp. GSB1]
MLRVETCRTLPFMRAAFPRGKYPRHGLPDYAHNMPKPKTVTGEKKYSKDIFPTLNIRIYRLFTSYGMVQSEQWLDEKKAVLRYRNIAAAEPNGNRLKTFRNFFHSLLFTR